MNSKLSVRRGNESIRKWYEIEISTETSLTSSVLTLQRKTTRRRFARRYSRDTPLKMQHSLYLERQVNWEANLRTSHKTKAQRITFDKDRACLEACGVW
jgi:hypothetical protein